MRSLEDQVRVLEAALKDKLTVVVLLTNSIIAIATLVVAFAFEANANVAWTGVLQDPTGWALLAFAEANPREHAASA